MKYKYKIEITYFQEIVFSSVLTEKEYKLLKEHFSEVSIRIVKKADKKNKT